MENQTNEKQARQRFLLNTAFRPPGLLRFAIIILLTLLGCFIGNSIDHDALYWGAAIGAGLGGALATMLAQKQYKTWKEQDDDGSNQ